MAIAVTQLISEIRADLNEHEQTVFRNPDLLAWLNDGMQAAVSEAHGMMEDWLTRRMRSTDSDETIQGEVYDPTSLTITGDTDLYTLPPNVIQIRSLEPLTAADRDAGVTFLPQSLSHIDTLRLGRTTLQQEQHSYFYSVVGPRTLRIVPTPYTGTSIGTELWYVAYPERLLISSTVTALPIQALKVLKAYVVWRALQSINMPDAQANYMVYQLMLKEFMSTLSPRQTNDPKFVEGAFDEEDMRGTLSY